MHSVPVRPRFYELDPYGHVNHSVYIQYFETARIELLATVGMGLDVLLDDDVQLVVTRLATRFVSAAGLHDDLTVDTGVIETGRVRSTWAQRIMRGDETITTQRIEFATTNGEGRPRRAPAALTEAMAPYAVGDDFYGSFTP